MYLDLKSLILTHATVDRPVFRLNVESRRPDLKVRIERRFDCSPVWPVQVRFGRTAGVRIMRLLEIESAQSSQPNVPANQSTRMHRIFFLYLPSGPSSAAAVRRLGFIFVFLKLVKLSL